MFERIERADVPRWVSVLLSPEAIRVQGRFATPIRSGLLVVGFWVALTLSTLNVLFLIAMSALPFSPFLSLVWLVVMAFALRYALLDWLCYLVGPTLCVEFTRDRQIVIRRSPGFIRAFSPQATYTVAFGVADPHALQRLRRIPKPSKFQTFRKRLLDDAAAVEFRFGAEQNVVATFSQRRRAEEFVAVCNWAMNELGKLDDEATSPLPAA